MFGLGMSCYGNLTNASMAYLPFMPYAPFGITNFGGDIQIFPVPDYQQSQIGLIFNPIAQMTGWPAGIYGGNQMNPYIDQNAVVAQASAMAAQSFNKLGSQEINEALQIISGQKAKIQAQLQAKDLKAEDKAKLEEQLKKLEEYEEQINAIKTSGMDPQTAYLKANELKCAVRDLIKGENTAQSPADNSKTGATGASGTSDSSSSPSASESSETKNQGSKTKPENYTTWCDAFHDATFKIGTDNDVFDACCEEITKDDVVERMIQWNQSYPGESFMEVFMADADKDQKLKYGRHIQRALRDKAQELGIDLSKDPDYIAITKELNSLFYIDNGVADNFNALIKKLAAKMNYQYDYKEYSMT